LLFFYFEFAARTIVEWIDRHPTMTDDLRKRMGILGFHIMKFQKGTGQKGK
jgi:hypothetical protein